MCLHHRQLDKPEVYDVPEDIVTAWKNAVSSKSRTAKNLLFQAFLKSGKDWSKSFGFKQ